MIVDPKLKHICQKIAGVCFRKGMPLFTIVRIFWDEYDRLFGWALLTPEQRDALIADVTTPRSILPPTSEAQENPI
jgi:hypothetical protein